jgi:hypothetical protein
LFVLRDPYRERLDAVGRHFVANGRQHGGPADARGPGDHDQWGGRNRSGHVEDVVDRLIASG